MKLVDLNKFMNLSDETSLGRTLCGIIGELTYKLSIKTYIQADKIMNDHVSSFFYNSSQPQNENNLQNLCDNNIRIFNGVF